MAFRPFETSIPHIMYAVLGGFVVLFGMFSLLIREKLYIGEACLAFVFGIIIGPYGANLVDPRSWGGGSEVTSNQITLEFTRVILAVGVFAIGVELPKAYMAKHWKSLFFLLFPVMTWGWLVSAGLIFALIPGLNFLSSLAVAACLTPTDPILAAAVVGGKYADKHVPAHLRHLLAAESGCNDGAAFPFLYLALYLVTQSSGRRAIQDWFLITWLYEVILGITFGAVLGYGFRHLMKFCERKDLIDRQSYVAQYVSLAILTIGVTTLLGSDDLLAAFSCGTAFAWDGFFNRQTEQAVFSSVIDLLFNITAFIFIGAWMPFNTFTNSELTLSVWRLIIIAILVLLLRRLPVMLLLFNWIPDVKTFREAIFSGHFGPIGVGAVFISTLAAEALPIPHSPPQDQEELLAATIQPVVAFMVLCSIAIHGLSIPFFSLGRRVHSVSRTWSRHQSIDPSAPEWATHTRRITRPEEIIINRDNIMERGEITTEKTTMAESEATSATGSAIPLKHEGSRGDHSATDEGRPDSPPDGDQTTAEWREGDDVIIERRAGPGEEVDVEVRHAPEGERGDIISTLRGPPGEAEHAATRFVKKLKTSVEDGAENLAEEARKIKFDLQGSVQAVEDNTHSLTEGGNQESSAEASGTRHHEHQEAASDDEENWSSDESSQRARDARTSDSNPRQRSPRRRGGLRHGQGTRRRRHSIRHAARPQSVNAPTSPIEHVPRDEDGDDRGRRFSARPDPIGGVGGGPGAYTIGRSAAHRRVDSLRTPLTRSSSPAHSVRSIRFAADTRPDSGPTTPRAEERDSPPNSSPKVTFSSPPSENFP